MRRVVPLLALLAELTGLAAPAGAQTRNKVQYQPREFRIIETTHFDVYYYDEERRAAVDAARMAERIYGRLSRILDHDFRDRKPIILYASQSDFQQTNVLRGHVGEGTGGVTESLKDRVVLPLTGSYAEFEHVLAHELVHSFQFDVLRRSALREAASPFSFVPSLWFMEGMAEYLSVGRIDAKTAAWLRDAALGGYLRTIEEMDRFDDFLSYRFGQSLWNYIGTKWGDEAIGLLLKRAAALGTDGAFRRTLGVSLAELTQEWHEAVRAAYLPEVRRADAVHRAGRRITRHRFPHGRGKSPSFIAPALAPDGSRILYLSDLGHDLYSFYDLYVADAETGEPIRRLVESARSADFESLLYLNSSADFAPDGRRAVFVAKSDGRDALYIQDVRDGRILRKFTPPLNGVQNPAWSSDGRRIVFTGLVGGISDLYAWDVAGDRLERLTDDRYARLHPAWSPDGSTIAFATDQGPGTDLETLVFSPLRIALLDLDTREIRLLPGEGDNINPVWAPDGRTLAFLSTRSGTFNVFLQDVEDATVRQLTDVLTGAMGEGALLTSPGLTWAREANRLAFSYFEEAGFNLYVVDDPESKAVPAPPASPLRTAASEIGRPRLVEARAGTEGTPEDGGLPSSFYRTEEGFRRSDFDLEARRQRRAERAAPGGLSLAALRDSATLALPDTAALAYREYDVKLTPDVVGRPQIGAEVGGFFGNGVYGGSFITLSDMLGNHNMLIAGDIQGSLDNARLFTSYSYLKSRMNFGVSFVQYPFFRFLGRQFGEVPGEEGEIGEFNIFQRDQYRSVGVDFQYPLSAFSRFDFGLSASSIDTDLVFQGVNAIDFSGINVTIDGRTRAFFQPSAAWLYDNSLPGFTGPLAGRRLRVAAVPSLGDLNLADLTLDFRNYAGLPGPLVLATRLLSFTRLGLKRASDAEEFELAWGGPYYLRGYDVGSFGREECAESREATERSFFCPAQEEVIGSSVLLLNTELRFPVLNPILMSWLPLNFPPLDAAVFFDVGTVFTPGVDVLVWNRRADGDRLRHREPLASWGVGLRMNIFFGILRVDWSRAPARGRFGHGIWSLSFGQFF